MSDLAQSRIAALAQDSALAVELAELASLAVRVDAGLLRRLRLELLPAADPGVESDLWFSPLVESRSGTGFQMAPEVLHELRGRLGRDRARVAAARRVTAAAHVRSAPAIQLEEELNGLALEYGDAAKAQIETRVRPLLRTLANGGSDALDLARWAVRAAVRLDPRVQQVPVVQTLLLAAAWHVGSREASRLPRDAARVGELGWALPSLDSVPRRRLSAAFVAGGLRFEEAPPSGAAIEVPATDPALVELEWDAGTQSERRTAEAAPGAIVPLAGDPDSVVLTTLAGRRYRLGREGAPTVSGQAAPPRAQAPDWMLESCMQLALEAGGRVLCMAFPIDPFHLLAPRARIGAATAVVDLRSGEPYEVVGASETTPDPPAAPLVVLRRADRNAHSEPLPLGEPAPDDETRVAVACFDGDEARWLDATLEARPPSPGELRSGLVFDPPPEFDIEVAALLAGAPVALGSRIVGIVAHAALPRFGSQAAYVQVVESPQVRELLARATAARGSEPAQSVAESEAPAAAEPVHEMVVRVVHGDVRAARHVVLVGHYVGDSIVGPEQVLDRLLGGQLSQRRAVGLYPGPIGTAALFMGRASPTQSAAPRPVGALVVGLGMLGELSAATLVQTVQQALLQLAVELSEAAAPNLGGIAVSSLLVGSGGHGIEVEDAASALVDAVLSANASLARSGRPERFVTLEVIEAERRRAMDALAALRGLAKRKGRQAGLVVETELAQGEPSAEAGDEAPEEDGWRTRLHITQLGDGGLRFVMLRRRTRAEAAVSPEGARLADDLLRRTVGAGRIEPGVWPTLSELLIPESARPGVRREDLLLQVDERAARYPWELVLDTGEQGRPPYCVERQFIRQMELASFREAGAAFGEAALVIGSVRTTDTKAFPPLPGVHAEAEMVAKTLSARLKVEALIESEAENVVSALFAMPYRLLHMSGHGVQRSGDERADVPSPMAGLVLSDDRALTPIEIQQMRTIPELVFVSCGYAPTRVELHTFAAQMAAGLIGAGVRAVVVAGWTVDDAAALTFIRRFYLQLLDGAPLGEAVRLARAETWERHRESHTWGAYQCYGDPEYRLFPETRAAA